MKIRPEGAELCHADRRMDGPTERYDDANGRFLKFCERAWKQIFNATPGVNDCKLSSLLKISEMDKLFQFHPIND
jgi:hypothetical protein